MKDTAGFESPYVRSDAGALAAVLTIAPSAAFDRLVPLQAEGSPIAERVLDQYAVFMGRLRDHGIRVITREPHSRAATETLVGDAAVLFPKGAILMRPSAIDRRGEVTAVETALGELGIPIIGRITAPGLLDGGDVAFAGDRAYIGLRRKGSNVLGRRQFEEFAREAGMRVAELALADDVHRLRNVFSFASDDMVIAAPSRVDVVPAGDLRVVEIPRGEEYAAGVLPLGERRVLANVRFRTAIAIMRRAKITVDAIDLWEFGKVGVGPFSLVLPLKRG